MRIIIAGIVCLLASSLSAFDLIDTVQSLRQKVWESEYIPESTIPVVPLTDYDEFEVTELFRAVTIEELEASLTDGYPYPWLEETLRDESIPWEDRYWLDCRMRAAISQSLYRFYDTENNPVQIEVDDITPGEYYWREQMIVDPAGLSIPEDAERPVYNTREFNRIDTGLIYNAFGRVVGNLAMPYGTLSRDASIGAFASTQEGTGMGDYDDQYYAVLLYPDGSFTEVELEGIGGYHGTVSQDGSTIAFFRHGSDSHGIDSYIDILDRQGMLVDRIQSEVDFSSVPPSLSFNGHYASCWVDGGHTALVDCWQGKVIHVTQETGTDRSTTRSSFSPDGEYFCIGGLARGSVLNISTGENYQYPETEPRAGSNDKTRVSCSNARIVTALITARREVSQRISSLELRLLTGDKQIYFNDLNERGYLGRGCDVEVSANGNLILVNRRSGMPLVVIRISGRG
ncbi:MAG: hypothetical protein GQ565_10875 [Candidatus Aegiribacteria sp.]|nr:hypothetical protein [Candidatus Aegiribacteria sp.]